MSIIHEHLSFYRKIFGSKGFWSEPFLMIGLPYIQGEDLPADFRYNNLQQLAQAKGLKKVYSLDLFDTNAQYQWDLNKPVASRYHETFGTVFDIGTMEHIFDTRQCLENYLRLVKVNGLFALVTPVNGYFAHGFHVFNPEAIIQALERNNFSIEYLTYSTSTGLEVNDPSIKKNIIMFVVARKKKSFKTFVVPQQGYWQDMYSTSTDYYQDSEKISTKREVILGKIRRAKQTLLQKMPIDLRTALLKYIS